MKPDQSIRSIQIRLFVLLLRAFAAVVLLLAFLILTVTAFYISYPTRYNPLERLPIVTRLETYYQVKGSWDGLETILPFPEPEGTNTLWAHTMLTDNGGKILVYQGSLDAPQVGQIYTAAKHDTRLPLEVNGQQVGMLVFSPSYMPAHGQLALSLLIPIGVISIFLGILTIVIGLLLMRRVVVPLSEVIAAARAVASGDLSTRVHASGPQDLRVLSDSFNHMASALEKSDRQRRDLLADVAHELRTPLTVIHGRLEGIVDGIYPLEEAQIIPALEESYLLERLVEDLRLLTLAETRQLQFEARDVSLSELASRAVDLFSAEAEERNVRISLDNHAVEALVHVDPQRTEQVIGNLVSNALRYVPDGGKIWLVVEEKAGEVSLSVNDNGPGVSDEDLQHLFQRFWRGEKSRSRASGGAGLGLAIARQLVEAQGGNIQAKNLPEGGLQVKARFPFA